MKKQLNAGVPFIHPYGIFWYHICLAFLKKYVCTSGDRNLMQRQHAYMTSYVTYKVQLLIAFLNCIV